ncbi:MAG: hypothetical protein AB7O56_09560 [Bauldia sp.]
MRIRSLFLGLLAAMTLALVVAAGFVVTAVVAGSGYEGSVALNFADRRAAGENPVLLAAVLGTPVTRVCLVESYRNVAEEAERLGLPTAGLPDVDFPDGGTGMLILGPEGVEHTVLSGLRDPGFCQSGTQLAIAFAADGATKFLIDLAITDPTIFVEYGGF